ncbi:hypothetical protein Q1695_014650 [Nippostrongylus brasiliensis]|nr:hypothetical protein Q1695_014650 [Nippostrongylus brasiliensis]
MQKQKTLTDFFASPARLSKSTSSSPRTPLFELEPKQPIRKRPKLSVGAHDIKQTTLDAGQKKFGGQYCQECDMMYSAESIDEVAMHDKHHNRLTDISNVKVSTSQLNLWLRKECSYSTSRGPVFRILPTSMSSLKRRSEQLIEEIVNPSVGFSPGLSIWGWDDRRTVWLSVISEGCTHYMACVIVTEPLYSAQCSVSGETIRDDDPIIGVNRIWTHPHARRKGVASDVLDIVRSRYFTGETVPRHRVAFSDPTDSGRRFAEHYIRDAKHPNHSLLVYCVTK